jgi:regulator of sigma E protease
MELLSTIFYFIITIGVIVFIHELGHFASAKMFGMRVERFSIGFPPRAFGKKIGETDYCISWVPIGGYVKIAGMVDESMDTEFLEKSPESWEFRSKPVWQRAVVMSAGVFMNLVLAVSIFWGLIYTQGKTVRPVTEVGYIIDESIAEKSGFEVYDKILAVNGSSVSRWDEIESLVYAEYMGKDLTFTVERGGFEVLIDVPRSDIPDVTQERFGLFPRGLVAVVGDVQSGKPAESIGMASGDTIIAINNIPVSYAQLAPTIRKNAGSEIMLSWNRGDSSITKAVTPTEEGVIGISLLAVYRGPIERIEYSLFEAFPVGVREVWFTSGVFFTNILQLFTGEASLERSVGGPVRIAQMANRSAEGGLASFLGFMALLSISLALLNILPFPALDGGHLVFLGYEAIFRKEVPNKIKIVIQQAGIVLLLVFMAFVLYNDVVNL